MTCESCKKLEALLAQAEKALEKVLNADFGCGCCSEGTSSVSSIKAVKEALEAIRKGRE